MDTTSAGDGGWIAVVSQWRKGHMRLPVTYLHALDLVGGRGRVLSTFEPAQGDDVAEGLEVQVGLDPYDPSPLEGASGLLLPGGGDIDPILYGATRHARTHNVSQRRDRFEMTLLGYALDRDMPVLAICHGMQLLNVYLGGKLEQHLADNPRRLEHDRDKPRAEPAHLVNLKERSVLAQVMGGVSVPINSHHHQGLNGAAPPLEEIGWADDGVLEAVTSTAHDWVLGVQWHPEAMADTDKREKAIFDSFVTAARRFSLADEGITAQSA